MRYVNFAKNVNLSIYGHIEPTTEIYQRKKFTFYIVVVKIRLPKPNFLIKSGIIIEEHNNTGNEINCIIIAL